MEPVPGPRRTIFVPSLGPLTLVLICGCLPFFDGCNQTPIIPYLALADTSLSGPDFLAIWLFWPFVTAIILFVASLLSCSLMSETNTKLYYWLTAAWTWVVSASFTILFISMSFYEGESDRIPLLLMAGISLLLSAIPAIPRHPWFVHWVGGASITTLPWRDLSSAFFLQLVWSVICIGWLGIYLGSPEDMLYGGKLTLLGFLLLVEASRLQFQHSRHLGTRPLFRFGMAYILVWTILFAFFMVWLGIHKDS